jgi:endonuclease III
MGKAKADKIRSLMESAGGRFSKELGIDLCSSKPREIFRWFLAAILFGARISERLATRTFQVFDREGVASPEKILNRGWDGLVQLLDEGGYARYDFKTATKLLGVAKALEEQYGGDLNRLHAIASDGVDLENRLQSLGKGIGQVTVNIFLREMRGIWEKADPLPGDLCVAAARRVGLIRMNLRSRREILEELQALWKTHGVPGMDFADFEAALVRRGIGERRKTGKTINHLD